MKRKLGIKYIVTEIIFSMAIAIAFYFFQSAPDESEIYIEATLVVPRSDSYQLFYHYKSDYNEAHSLKLPVEEQIYFQTIKFQLPKDSLLSKFRLDFGDKKGSVVVKEILFKTENKNFSWTGSNIMKMFSPSPGLSNMRLKDENVEYQITGEDPYIHIKKDVTQEHKTLIHQVQLNRQRNRIRSTVLIFIVCFLCIRITGVSEKVLKLVLDPHRLMLSIFFIILFLPVVNMVFEIFPDVKNYEKRQLKPSPVFDVAHFSDYTKNYNNYFNDHFGFRSLMVKLNSYYKYIVLRSSPRPTIIEGKEKWLFLPENTDLLGWEEINAIEKNQEEIAKRLKKNGIDYYLVIAPEKSYIYPEYFPDHYKKTKFKARMDQLVGRLLKNNNLKTIDLRKTLLDAKSKRQLYYPTDTHWNMYGAMVAYTQLINEIRKDHPEISTKQIGEYDFSERDRIGGDISYLFNAPELFPMKDWIPKENGKEMYSLYYIDSMLPYKYTYTNKTSRNNKKILLLHDSYALYWRAPLANDFYQTTVHWTNYFDNKIIEETKPDIVVHEMVNRFILNLSHP